MDAESLILFRLLFYPREFLAMLAPDFPFDPSQQFLLDQIAGAYLFLAFAESMVLQSTPDIRVWRMMICGLLLSDLLYVYSFGPVFKDLLLAPWALKSGDWLNVIGTVPQLAARIAFILGVGVTSAGQPQGKKKEKA